MSETCLTCRATAAACHCGDYVSSLPPTAEQIAAADAYDRTMSGGDVFADDAKAEGR